jgi:hypothetical protein
MNTAAATTKVREIMAAATGLPFMVGEAAAREGIAAAPVVAAQIVATNVAFETAEKTAGAKYPAVYVYCAGLTNGLKEKFRTFSGKLHMAVEVRVSHDRLEGLDKQVQVYADAVAQVLDAHRGDWGRGMYYTGTYEMEFGPVKHGGRNFIQTAKIQFDVDGSW